jgi:predicted ABC-type ATPase
LPEMYVFAGCNGAGKSTLIEHFDEAFVIVINPDTIAKRLNPDDPRSVDLSAGKQAIKEINDALAQGISFAVETTLSGQLILNQMKKARELGYRVILYYIGLQDVQMHIDRVRTRVLEGGHFIATKDIIRRYDLSLANLKIASKVADVIVVIDNSGEEFEMLLEVMDGKVMYQSETMPTWLRVLMIR